MSLTDLMEALCLRSVVSLTSSSLVAYAPFLLRDTRHRTIPRTRPTTSTKTRTTTTATIPAIMPTSSANGVEVGGIVIDVERDGIALVGAAMEEDGASSELVEENMLEVALVTIDVCTLEEVIVEVIDGIAVLGSTAGEEELEGNGVVMTGMVVVTGCSEELGEGIFSVTVLGPKLDARIGDGNDVVVPVERTARR